MTLKSGIITTEDFYVNQIDHVGWVLVAPYLVLRIHYQISAPYSRIQLYTVRTPLFIDPPFSYDDWCNSDIRRVKLPNRLWNSRLDEMAYVNRLADWGRSVTLKRLNK